MPPTKKATKLRSIMPPTKKKATSLKRKKMDNSDDSMSESSNEPEKEEYNYKKSYHVRTTIPITKTEHATYGGKKFEDYLYDEKFLILSGMDKSLIIHYFIVDYHKRFFKNNKKMSWEQRYEEARKYFDLHWSWEVHKKYDLNCDNFQCVNEMNEYHLYFTPHLTTIKELWMVSKPSLYPNAGYGLFNALPLRQGMMIGTLFGFTKKEETNGYDSRNKLIVGYDFTTQFGVLNAVCGMNTKLHSGRKPHPLFGMHMINDTVKTKIKGSAVRYSKRKTTAVFYDDLSVIMHKGLRARNELTLSYDSANAIVESV